MTGTRALVVGAGAMGRRHSDAIIAAGDQVTVMVDADTARARAIAPQATVVQSLEEAMELRDCFDVAVIATPSSLHLEHAAALIAVDCPVLIEKPHRIPGQNVHAIRQLLEASKGYAFVGMTTRHWPGFEALAEALARGELGEVLSYQDRMGYRLAHGALPPWYFESGMSGGGILVTNGVHAIDRARAILGDFTISESVSSALFDGHETESYVQLSGTTPGGARIAIELIWAPYEPLQTGVVLIGTRGNAIVRMDGSWTISAAGTQTHGEAINVEVLPFALQWQAFLAQREGFSIEDLEPTLELIEDVYGAVSHG